MKNPKIYLCSFGSFNFHPAAYRFYNQALDMGIFEDIFIYNETNLSLDYKRHFRDKIYLQNTDSIESNKETLVPHTKPKDLENLDSKNTESNHRFHLNFSDYYRKSKSLPQDSKVKFSRGFGYWSWKPDVVLQSLSKIESGDILLYIDIGCHLVESSKHKLLEKLEILNDYDIAGFKSLLPCHNIQYTKSSVFAHFGVRENMEIVRDRQIKGGVFFMRKSERVMSFMNEWQQILWEHFELVDDSKSSVEDFPDFLEHRHDQSIFDMLMRKYAFFTFTDYHDGHTDNAEFGILDKRAKINMKLRNKPLTLKILSILGKIFPIKSVRKDTREIIKMFDA